MIEKRSCQDDIPVLGVTVGDYWSWAYSDILSNTDRAVFTEFVVGTALGVTDAPRVEWDAVDLRYGDKTIEVKSSVYVQSWHQEQDPPSQISFDLKERLSWDAATNTYQVEPGSRLLRLLRLRREGSEQGQRPRRGSVGILRSRHRGDKPAAWLPEDRCLEYHRTANRTGRLLPDQGTG
jgi:hypothetical protein